MKMNSTKKKRNYSTEIGNSTDRFERKTGMNKNESKRGTCSAACDLDNKRTLAAREKG